MPAPLSFLSIYRATPLERIDMFRRGMLASDAKRIFADLATGQGAGINALNLSTATPNKKANTAKPCHRAKPSAPLAFQNSSASGRR